MRKYKYTILIFSLGLFIKYFVKFFTPTIYSEFLSIIPYIFLAIGLCLDAFDMDVNKVELFGFLIGVNIAFIIQKKDCFTGDFKTLIIVSLSWIFAKLSSWIYKNYKKHFKDNPL